MCRESKVPELVGFRLPVCLLLAFSVSIVTVTGCERADGVLLDGGRYPDGGLVSGLPCVTDGDCTEGRYCSAAGICWIDCVADKDCSYFLKDPSGPNNMYCSKCGRCIDIGKEDTACHNGKKDIPCDSSEYCVEQYGKKFLCSLDNYCTESCKTDAECRNTMGSRFACTDMGDGTKICTKPYECTWDNRCYGFGWDYICDLPPEIDQFTNTYPQSGGRQVVSTCVTNQSGVDWGDYVDSAIPSYGYHGVWGVLLNTAARSTGMPLFAYMNTLDIQYILMKVTQGAGGTLELNLKYCSIELVNFLDTDEPFEATKIIIPRRYTEFVPVQVMSTARPVPEINAGASFNTQWILDVRGANLPNPAIDPIPDFRNCPQGNCSTQWDQDKDGRPGMTTLITGIVGAGEIYISKRATFALEMNVVDRDHVQGLVPHTFEQGVIDSNPPSFNYILTYSDMEPDRSYFKALRMSDTVSCDDVLKESAIDGSFIQFQWHCPECIK